MSYRPSVSAESNIFIARPGTAASVASLTFTLAGMTTPVTVTADVAGVAGNSITLEFDGTDDVADAIATWNAANEGNEATLTAGTGTQVPDNEEEAVLVGGRDAISASAAQPTTINTVSRNGGTVTVTGILDAEILAEDDLTFELTLPPKAENFESADDAFGFALAVLDDDSDKDAGYVEAKPSSKLVKVVIPAATLTAGEAARIRYSFTYQDIN
jgi:hypothetical protein